MTILAERNAQRKPSDTSTDRYILLLLLEKLLAIIEGIWADEVKGNRSGSDTQRQRVIRKAHQALGEWFELETLNRQECL